MSQSRFAIIPTAAVMDTSLTSTQMRVLMVLATFSDRDNRSYPKQATLAEACGKARETVNRALQVLAEKGYVQVVQRWREDGSQTSNSYTVLLDGDVIAESQGCDATITGGVTPEDHTGCDAKRSHHEDTQLNTPTETPSVGSVVKLIWEASPKVSKGRSSQKLLRTQIEKLLKEFPEERLRKAWQAYLDAPDTGRDDFKFVPAVDRWFRDRKFEAWMPAEPDLLDALSVGEAKPWHPDLEHSFSVLAELGTWLGARYGYPLDPRSPEASYDARLYERFNIKREEE